MKSFGIFLIIALFVGIGLFLNRYNISQWVPGQSYLPDIKAYTGTVPANHPEFGKARWIHRVDGIKRYQDVQNEYNGFEIDVLYNAEQGTLEVGHDPEPGFSLPLEQLFAAIDTPQHCFFWLDMKQLDTTNAPAIHKALLSIAQKFGIQKNILVESAQPQSLGIFTRSGFYTSYYLPPFHVYKCSKEDIKKYYDMVCAQLSKSQVCALSGNHMQFLFMEKYFPGYDHLLWDLDRFPWRSNLMTKLYKKSPRVNIILTQKITKHWR